MKIGITGHQKLGNENTVKWIDSCIISVMEEFGEVEGYTSLAVGADQLFAKVLLRCNFSYTAVIPSSGYEETFNKGDLRNYNYFLSNASKIVELPFDTPSEKSFYEAGKFIVNKVDLLLAIWNEEPAKGLGGTGDVVEYAVNKGVKVVVINNVLKNKSIL